MRERQSDGLKDGEASLYTQRERSRTTQSARSVTTTVFGTVGIGCPGGSRQSDNLRRNRGATDFETSNLLKSRGTLVRDFQFVGTDSQRISRPRIPWNRGATEFQDLEFVGIEGAKVFEISNFLERVSDRADRDNDCVDGGRPSGKGCRKVADRGREGGKNWTSLVAGYDHGGGVGSKVGCNWWVAWNLRMDRVGLWEVTPETSNRNTVGLFWVIPETSLSAFTNRKTDRR